MIKLLRKISRTLRRNKWKNTGKLETAVETISDWLATQINRLRGVLEKTHEVLLFIPVIYKSYTWDYSSIFVILEHWLKRMHRVQKEDSYHLHSDVYAKQIQTCLELLKRINTQSFYENMIYTEHYKKWGESEMITTPHETNSELLYMNIVYPNVKNEKDVKLQREEFILLMKHEEYLYKQDVDMLFKQIKKYHKHWWA